MKMPKGIFLLSFMNLDVEPALSTKEMQEIGDKIKPIVKDMDIDVIVTNRVCLPIGRDELKRYLRGMLQTIQKMDGEQNEPRRI